MIVKETRVLNVEERAQVASQLGVVLTGPDTRSQVWRWLWWGGLALLPLGSAIVSGNLINIFVVLLIEIVFGLWLYWWTNKTDQQWRQAAEVLQRLLREKPMIITTISDAEWVSVEAYGMHLWLVQADFSTVLKVDSRSVREAQRFPTTRFVTLDLDFEESVMIGREAVRGFRVIFPSGEPVQSIAVIGAPDFERIRHLLPQEFEPGHGRLVSMLSTIGISVKS